MNAWIVKNLNELLGTCPHESEIDDYLLRMRGHSLKMVTFLARFNREFGKGPRILDFISNPCLATLKSSVSRELN